MGSRQNQHFQRPTRGPDTPATSPQGPPAPCSWDFSQSLTVRPQLALRGPPDPGYGPPLRLWNPDFLVVKMGGDGGLPLRGPLWRLMTYVAQSAFKPPDEKGSSRRLLPDEHVPALNWLLPPYFKTPPRQRDPDERQCPGAHWWLLDCTSPEAEELTEMEHPIQHPLYGDALPLYVQTWDQEHKSHIWTNIWCPPWGRAETATSLLWLGTFPG